MSKTKEKIVYDLFIDDETALKSIDIKEQTTIKDPSGILRDLVYFEYLTKETENNNTFFKKTRKQYNVETRKREIREENHEIVLNKIFAGSHLIYNLGHEIINFIKGNDNQRYIYINPWGEINAQFAHEIKYVFHIIESSVKKESGIYELVAISEVEENGFNPNYGDRDLEKRNSPSFDNYTFDKIFNCEDDSDKAHVYTFKANRLYKPTEGHRIIIKINCEEAKQNEPINNVLTIELMCNPQHSICYADGTGKKTCSSDVNENNDLDILTQLIQNNEFIVESDENINIDELDGEQCLSFICDRTNLEDSLSNQIAYFLGRDKNLTYIFLHDFLGITNIGQNEHFEIIREKENHIDLFFKSDNNVIVVENKIDSSIRDNQLDSYYTHVINKYDSQHKSFYVLAPEYNNITQEKINTEYTNGEHYTLKNYYEFYEHFQNTEYSPNNTQSEYGNFLYKEFLKTIKYVSMSKAQQQKNISYIRFKQRIEELNHGND